MPHDHGAEIDALAARDVIGDEIVQHLQVMLASCTETKDGSVIPADHILQAKMLMAQWKKLNRDFEAIIRKNGRS